MAITPLPERTTTDPNSAADVNFLNDNDVSIDTRVISLEATSTGLFENSIINGDFRENNYPYIVKEVESGTVSTTNYYPLDRWKTINIDSVNHTTKYEEVTIGGVVTNAFTVKAKASSGATNFLAVRQYIDVSDLLELRGRNVVLGFYVKSNTAKVRGRLDSNYITGTTSYSSYSDDGETWEFIAVPVTTIGTTKIGGAGEYLSVDIGFMFDSFTTDDYFSIAFVKLQVGLVATPFQPLPMAQTSLKCSMFAHQIIGAGVSSIAGAGVAISTTEALIRIHLPQNFLGVPTAIIGGTATDWKLWDGVTPTDVTGGLTIDANYSTEDMCVLYVTDSTASLTADGRTYNLICDGTAGRSFTIQREY